MTCRISLSCVVCSTIYLIHKHIHTYAHTHTHLHTYTNKHTYTYMHAHAPTHSNSGLQFIYMCMCMYGFVGHIRTTLYLVRVIEIGRYFSWLLLCDRACPVQQPAFFLSGVLLLGFGKLLSIKKKCHCRFVVMCVGFTTNCQNMSRSKSLPPDIHPLLFYTP